MAPAALTSDKSAAMDEQRLRDRILDRLTETGRGPVEIAMDLDRKRDFLTDFLNGRKHKLPYEFLEGLAVRLSCPPGYFLDERVQLAPASESDAPQPLAKPSELGDLVDPAEIEEFLRDRHSEVRERLGSQLALLEIERRIPVAGEVAAGLWRETFAIEAHEIDEYVTIDVKGYERSRLYALKIVGPSMNLVYPDGRYVVVAPAAEAGVRIGDYVVVERYKADLVEVTVKELARERGQLVLYPRSSDPRFQEPIRLKASEDDQTAPRIIGVVVADYARRERPPIPFRR